MFGPHFRWEYGFLAQWGDKCWAKAVDIPVTVDRVLAGCLLEFLFESQAIPETQLTSLGADNDEISRHRIYGRSRHRAGLVEMVRVGCGRGDHGPSAQ